MPIEDAGRDGVLRLVVGDDGIDGQHLHLEGPVGHLTDGRGPALLELEVRVARRIGRLEAQRLLRGGCDGAGQQCGGGNPGAACKFRHVISPVTKIQPSSRGRFP